MFRRTWERGLVLCVMLLVLTASFAWSQATTGTLNGVVRDQSGAVIPGAAVTLTKTDTGVILKTTSTATGFYEFQGLVPGPYLVAVESAGMAKFEGKLTMIVGQIETVDATMQVGKATQVVTVQDVTPMVQTNNGTQYYVVDQKRMQQLPFNGRSIMNYLETIPGMEGTRSMGMEDNNYGFYLDGADIASRDSWNEITAVGPGVDSIQEFAVEENAGSAKYARPVNFIATTKSGTNQFHGTAFEDILNNDLMYARTRTTFGPAPYLNRNEFGVSGGGPVYIPKVYNGTGKTFWFFAWEGMHDDSPTVIGAPVPTQAWREGDLAGDIDVNQVPYTIYDPYTTDPATGARKAYVNNQITEPESPLAKFLMAYEPMPNVANVNPNIGDNWFGPVVDWAKDYTLSARVDQKVGEKDLFYGRYTRGMLNQEDQFYTLPSTDYSKVPSGTQGGPNPNWSLGLHWVHTFSPTFFNEVLASTSWVTFFDGTGNLSTNYDAELGLPNPFGVGGWPGIYSAGFLNVPPEGLSWETQNTNAAHETYTVIDDNATKVWGKHEFQFGAHFRADREDVLPAQQQVAGSDDFSTMATGLYNPLAGAAYPLPVPYTGDNFANFYLGIGEYSNQLVPSSFNGRQKEYAAYFQDNWKITPRLTLNMGLRWEYYAPFTEAQGIMESFDPSYGSNLSTTQNVGNGVNQTLSEQGALVLASPLAQYYRLGFTNPSIISREEQLGMNIVSAAQAGYPSSLATKNPHDFGPHLGFAYRLTGGAKPFVLRGGYSLSYFHVEIGAWAQRMRMNTPTDYRYYYSLTNSAFEPAAANNIPDYGLISVPTNIAGSTGATSVANLVTTTNTNSIQPSSSFMDYWALHQPTPRVHTWNLTLEKEIPWKMVLSAAYVGNHSYGNEMLYNYNNSAPPYIWYKTTGLPLPTGTYAGTAMNQFNQASWGNTVEEWLNTGWGNSNGAQIQLKRTFQHGSTLQFFYTLDNNFGAGGQGYSGTSLIPTPNQFLPGTIPVLSTPPTSFTRQLATLEREYDYQRDTSIPKNRYTWNFIQDLPFGRGQHFLGGAHGIVDKLVSGWQVAGIGTAYKPYTELPNPSTGPNYMAYFPTGTPIQQYGYKYKIQDCTSGTCYPGYLFYNGYIPSNLINTPGGYEGIPANYKPAFQPLIPYGATTAPNMPAGTNLSGFWNTDTVWVPLTGVSAVQGTVAQTTWSGFSPFWQEYLPADWQWDQDASLIKNFPFKEHYNFRLECDWFNVFNHPGNPNSFNVDGPTGILSTQSSGMSPRTLQLVVRLSW